MPKKLTRSQIPFATGSYKQAYMPVMDDNGLFDDIPGSNKIITSSKIGSKSFSNANNKYKLYHAFTELLWLNIFSRVDLAPTLYAIALDNMQTINTYYIHDGTHRVEDVYNDVASTRNLAYPITIHTLVESCDKHKLGDIVGYDKLIEDEEMLLKCVHTLIEKLIYHETLFIDFKANNICVKEVSGQPLFMFLDFDPQFIIPFSEFGLPAEDIEKSCRTYMFVMFVGLFVRSDTYGKMFKNSIQTIIRQRYLAKYDIMAMLNTFVKLEIPDYRLCLLSKNPLTMLFHYFENSLHSDLNKVYDCIDIKAVQYSSGLSALDSLHTTLYNLVCGEGDHNDWLTKPLAHVDITNYKKTYEKIVLPGYQRQYVQNVMSDFNAGDLVRPYLGTPTVLPEYDPEMLNEKPSLSPGFGDNIAKNILGEGVYNLLANKKRRTTKNGGKRIRGLRSKHNRFRMKKNIV